MSDHERTGWRDQAYSKWHRDLPWQLGFIDIDWVEYCKAPYCGRILALCELAADYGKDTKDFRLTQELAKRADLRAYVVLYRVVAGKVAALRVKRVWPSPEAAFESLSPLEWMERLKAMRCHEVQPKAGVEPVVELWPDGINPYVSAKRRAEILGTHAPEQDGFF